MVYWYETLNFLILIQDFIFWLFQMRICSKLQKMYLSTIKDNGILIDFNGISTCLGLFYA